jgi:hypothetical protein
VYVYKKFLVSVDLPVLTPLVRDAGLKFIDVGGRGEAFSQLLPLASFADYYAQSGPQLLESLVGIHTESEFQPLYKEQSLFADVDTFLRQAGFELVALKRTMLRRAGFRKTLYSKRQIAWAHCLYLRNAATWVDADAIPPHRIWRLLAVAIAFQHFDLAFEIVSVVRSAGLLSDTDANQLDEDVERCAAFATRHVVQKVGSDGVAGLLAASFRDKGQFD